MLRILLAIWTAACAIGLVAGGVLAQPAAAEDPLCTCRAKEGRRVQIGDTLCLDTAQGPRLAQCIKNQNLTFWHFSEEGCALSLLSRRMRGPSGS